MELLNDKNFDEKINEKSLVLVDFFATWCGPCRMQAPILERVKEELGDQVEIYKLDVDENEQTAKQFGVMSIPTLILFKNGKEVAKNVGLMSQEAVVDLINENK
ncbi:MAG: thioredoxin [Christensenellales bacterium]